jgi:hypothetical protein
VGLRTREHVRGKRESARPRRGHASHAEGRDAARRGWGRAQGAALREGGARNAALGAGPLRRGQGRRVGGPRTAPGGPGRRAEGKQVAGGPRRGRGGGERRHAGGRGGAAPRRRGEGGAGASAAPGGKGRCSGERRHAGAGAGRALPRRGRGGAALGQAAARSVSRGERTGEKGRARAGEKRGGRRERVKGRGGENSPPGIQILAISTPNLGHHEGERGRGGRRRGRLLCGRNQMSQTDLGEGARRGRAGAPGARGSGRAESGRAGPGWVTSRIETHDTHDH